ncbi:MAG: ECF transporter S component [Oscillospiraceae bacterium]|nr:ECF transporter S component [Oscillospiraceae bacterium]
MKKLVFSALFAALTCCATLLRFPAGIGYIHAGDAVVLLAAFLLDPLWGAFAAGLGSALADLLAGYALYAPASLVIKLLMALTAGLVLRKCPVKRETFKAVTAGVLAELIMLAGYFCFECFVLGYGAAALGSVPTNLIQAAFGVAAGVSLYGALAKYPGLADLKRR